MTQNRDMEKFLKELQNFVDAHQDEIKDQADLEKMADRFILEHGMLHRAIDQGRRLLELCETDNLGVRYALMHLYACVEDEMHALALVKQFDAG